MQTVVKASTTIDGVFVTSNFNYEIPDDLSTAVDSYGEDQVYNLFRRQLIVDIQAPARKSITDIWETVPTDTRDSLVVMPEDAEKGTPTATLSHLYQQQLQEEMSGWKPGQKAQRVRVVRSTDPVKDILDGWDTFSEEKRAELRNTLKSLLGL